MKRKTLDDPCEMIHWELREGDASTLITTDINHIKKIIDYARLSIILKLPTNLEELHLALTKLSGIKTNKDENVLLLNNNIGNNIVAFSTTIFKRV